MGDFKPLMEYKGKSFLLSIISKMNLVCDEIIVVTGHNKDLIEKELSQISNKVNIKTVYNKDYNEGMFTSLQCGLAATESYDWVLYHFVDQPTISENFYRQIISEIDYSSNWIQPLYEGRKGHPLIFSREVVEQILSADKKSNLKEITTSIKIRKKFWDCKYPQILDDIDTLEKYKQLIK
jgi:molybdenum cofactor cytidylyltransferase